MLTGGNKRLIWKGTGDNARYMYHRKKKRNCGSPGSLTVTFIRHDNDHKIPRTPSEIFDLNRQVATRMEKIFLKRGVPVVPSLGKEIFILALRHQLKMMSGNNDIWRQFSLCLLIFDL